MPIKVVIASVLKPIDDPRMYFKLGITIQTTLNADVNIIGFSGKEYNDIKQYPIFSFQRTDYRRLVSPVTFYKKIRKIKPDVIIVCSYELLLAAKLYKNLNKGVKIIYDVRENYYLNALYSPYGNSSISKIIAKLIRFIEIISAKSIDYFILAEKIYEKQLGFISRKHYRILENKMYDSDIKKVKRDPLHILFSGTLSKQSGIEKCLSLVGYLNSINKDVKLTIVGFTSEPNYRNYLINKVQSLSFVTLITDEKPIPHSKITEYTSQAGFGFISYEDLPHLNGKIPTKFFEYLFFELPIILFKTTWLKDEVAFDKIGIPIDQITELKPDMLRNFNYSKPTFYNSRWNYREDLEEIFKAIY